MSEHDPQAGAGADAPPNGPAPTDARHRAPSRVERAETRRRRWRRMAVALGAPSAIGAGLTLLALFVGGGAAAGLFEEFAAVELLQLALWVVAMFGAGVALVRAPTGRDRWNAGWLITLAALAFMREMDLHELIDADHWPEYGVSFMLNWWTDGSVSLVRKLVWASVFAVVGLLLCVPPLVVRAPVVRMLKNADLGLWLIIAAFGWLALGYIADDLIGRGQFVSKEASKAAEETAELVGVAFFAAALIREAFAPLTTRVQPLNAASRAADQK